MKRLIIAAAAIISLASCGNKDTVTPQERAIISLYNDKDIDVAQIVRVDGVFVSITRHQKHRTSPDTLYVGAPSPMLEAAIKYNQDSLPLTDTLTTD